MAAGSACVHQRYIRIHMSSHCEKPEAILSAADPGGFGQIVLVSPGLSVYTCTLGTGEPAYLQWVGRLHREGKEASSI